jgi:topoisomerase-4 subunit A
VRQGHALDLSAVTFKDGDRAWTALECRSVDALAILSTEGRAFSVQVAALPDGRGMGAPLTSFVDMGRGKIAYVLSGRPEEALLIGKSSGYGFICTFADLLTRQKAGKAFLTLEEGASLLPPVRIAGKDHLAALAEDGRLLVFPLEQMKRLSGGKGVQIIGLHPGETLREMVAWAGSTVTISGIFRNKVKTLLSDERHLSQRARRGILAGLIKSPTLLG